MRAVDVIVKKREGQALSPREIEFLIGGFAGGEIPDYQMSAWAMAVVLNGMTDEETTALTLAMARSGDVLDLHEVAPRAVDKHSSGGVGDKTSLVVAPLVAACGLPVGKMSGRGLGFSGGTLDKLESIPGYRTDLSTREFLDQLERIGVVLSGQTGDLAPADGRLYALRDVTGTVQSIPLIASSIMSKKIAAGARAIVLDVKVGEGAFMKDLDEARRLAETMVAIARQADRRAVGLLADMNQPLGNAVGNALEVREAIETLHGGGPEGFRAHCLTVAGHMLALGEAAASAEDGAARADEILQKGAGWEKFRALVAAQGGDVRSIDEPDRLPGASIVRTVDAPRGGYLHGIDARVVGETAVMLGAGREKKGDPVDHAVGIVVRRKVGDRVDPGDPVFTVHANDSQALEGARERLLDGLTWSDSPVDPLPLFYGVVEQNSIG